MEREVAERFERIEADLEATAKGLLTVQQLPLTMVRSQAEFEQTLELSIQAHDARLSRIEDNPDLLIRAITAEHTNGRSSGE